MEIDDMTIHMMTLKAAYPNAWPQTLPTEALMGTWYDNFQHVSNDLFTAAVKHAIATYEWPSIKDMWDAILDVAGVPSMYDAKKCFDLMTDRWHDKKHEPQAIEKHPLIVVTLRDFRYPDEVAAMGSFAMKRLEDTFNECRKAYRNHVIQPRKVAILEAAYRNTAQLESDRKKQITEGD